MRTDLSSSDVQLKKIQIIFYVNLSFIYTYFVVFLVSLFELTSFQNICCENIQNTEPPYNMTSIFHILVDLCQSLQSI